VQTVKPKVVKRVKPKPKPKPKKKVAVTPKPAAAPPPPPIPQADSGTELAASSADPRGSSSVPLFVGMVGLLLALIAIGVAVMPARPLPVDMGFRLERNRQTIAFTGIGIGLVCVLVGLLNGLSG
jgi:hypothetical protein